MLDINKHKIYLVQILKDIYSDLELANWLGFKGGSALMFFYDLPRFSIDLDFNLITEDREKDVFNKVRGILLKYGTIHDEAQKFFGPLLVLDYGSGERKLKVEISNRRFGDRYELRNLLGIKMKVMSAPDMLAHKLCALRDRSSVASRDIFDCWFLMNKHIPVNKAIIENRMNMSLPVYLGKCIEMMESLKNRSLLQGMGELVDNEMKNFVRMELKNEVIILFRYYRDFPIIG
jgi:predicted nucleotidyltransferase component of viral defense system